MLAVFLVGLLALCQAQPYCTQLPANTINTIPEISDPPIGVGGTYQFTCVAGSTVTGVAGGATIFTATCTDPSLPVQWDSACQFYPNFCEVAGNQAQNRLAPTAGGFRGTSTTFTCAPGHTLTYAFPSASTYRRVAQYTTTVSCAAVDFVSGVFVTTNGAVGQGRWVAFDPVITSKAVPVYCEPIDNYCPANLYPFPSVFLSAADELIFPDATFSLPRDSTFFGFSTPTITVTGKNRIASTTTANCGPGFLSTTTLGATNPGVTCVPVSDYAANGGQWNYTAEVAKADCYKQPIYCSVLGGPWVNTAQVYPVLTSNQFPVDADPGTTNSVPNPEAEILCLDGYAVFVDSRSTSKHPLHCVPKDHTSGDYKVLVGSTKASYPLSDFSTVVASLTPCQPINDYCSTDSSKQPPGFNFNYFAEPLNAIKGTTAPMYCLEGYQWDATRTFQDRQCRTGSTSLYGAQGVDISRQWGFFVTLGSGNFLTNNDLTACVQNNAYCTPPLSGFTVHSPLTGLSSSVGNVVASTISNAAYHLDCPVGESSDGTRSGAATRLYCSGARTLNAEWSLNGAWSTTLSSQTAPTCTSIPNFCQQTVDGTIEDTGPTPTTNPDGFNLDRRTRFCPNGYSAATHLIPATFNTQPNDQLLICVENTTANGIVYNSATGQIGKWIDFSNNQDLTNCVKSTLYCDSVSNVQSAGFWSSSGVPATRTIGTNWNARCSAGYSLDSTKGGQATNTLICSDDSAQKGCWQAVGSSSTCDDSCQKVVDYCTAPPNVTANTAQIGDSRTLVCLNGFTTNGASPSTSPNNLQVSAVCSAYPSWSSGSDPAGIWLAGGSPFSGCLPAGSYCSISSNVVAPVGGQVNQQATIICAVGYRVKQAAAPCTAPPSYPSRAVTATCAAVTPLQGTWVYASGCPVECEQIPDFCADDDSEAPLRGKLFSTTYQGTSGFTCEVGTALSKITSPTSHFTRATASTDGYGTVFNSPAPFQARCEINGPATDSTVSGVWVVSGTSIYPTCVPVSDFCNSGFPLNPAYQHYTASSVLPSTTSVGYPWEVTDASLGTGTYHSNLYVQCDEGYILDRTTGAGPLRYEDNFLGNRPWSAASGAFYWNSGVYLCEANGVFASVAGKSVGSDVCDRVKLCAFDTTPSPITRKICFDPENPTAQTPAPCALDAPVRFFCEIGYLPQAASAAGYYDPTATQSQISVVTSATCSLSTTDLLSTITSATTSQYWYETSSYWSSTTFLTGASVFFYNFDFLKTSDGSVISESSLCVLSDNYCSLLNPTNNPNRSPYLANVAALTINTRSIDSLANDFICAKGYEVVFGLDRNIVNPLGSQTTKTLVECKANGRLSQAGEWSVLPDVSSTTFQPVSCALIDSYCPGTLGSNASVSSIANSSKLGTAGTYCCAAGYSTTGVSATGSFANLAMTCTAGPSALTTFARDGIWKNAANALPSCLRISDFCPVVTGAQLSTSSGPTSIGQTATYTCATGYMLSGQPSLLTSGSFTCTAPSNLCGQGTNSGSLRLNGQVPSCVPINPYCPQTTITMINSTAPSTIQTSPTPAQVGNTQSISCADGWSANGLAGVSNAGFTTTCGTSTQTVGAWSPTSCLPTTNYCTASTAANTVATQSIALFAGEQLNAVARVDCLTGYTVGGVNGGATTSFITCQPSTVGFGRWTVGGDFLTPTYCQPANRTCSLAPPSATLGANATGATDSYATYTCIPGYTFNGAATGVSTGLAQCLFSDKLWHIGGPAVSCQQATDWCPTDAAYNAANPGSILTLSTSPTLNANAGFSCRNGYSTPFTGSAVCRTNRTWSAIPCSLISGYCTNAALGTILAPAPAVSSLGDTRLVTCAIGYQFVSGLFLDVPVNCTALNQLTGVYKDGSGLDAFCGPTQSYCPTTTFSGTLTVTGNLEIGATATLTCNTGYRLASGLSSTGVDCSASTRASGVWTSSGVVQNCSAIPDYCPANIAFDDNSVPAASTTVGSSQVISCPAGWQATSGSSVASVVCNPVPGSPGQGQWSLGASAWTGCTRIPNFCPRNSVPNAILSTNATTIDSNNVATCLPGQTATGFKDGATSFPVTCTVTGWDNAGQSAACAVVLDYCNVFNLNRGAVANGNASFGSANVFQCSTGYQYNGATSADISCNITGLWVDVNGEAFRGCSLNLNFCPDVVEANGIVSNGTNALNAVRNVVCDPGFSSGGSASRTCLSSGDWSNVIVCADIDECLTSPCSSSEVCTNEPGNYTCTACGLNEVVANNQCICDAPLYAGTSGNCTCTCSAHATCGSNACVCDAGYVNAVGSCELCGADTQRCCDVSPSCGTGLVCSNGYCEVPVSPTPTPTPVVTPPPTQPPPSTPPPSTPPPPSGSSSADDAGRLAVLFAYLLL